MKREARDRKFGDLGSVALEEQKTVGDRPIEDFRHEGRMKMERLAGASLERLLRGGYHIFKS